MNEATVYGGLAVRRGSLNVPAGNTSFKATILADGGPTPGQIVADLDGVDIDLSQLTTPGLCVIQNLDAANYVLVGMQDNAGTFIPMEEILPGEKYVKRLYRELGHKMSTVGTGTGPSGTGAKLHIKAVGAPCKVLVDAYNK